MRSVTYSMGVSLDGYITGPDGGTEGGVADRFDLRPPLIPSAQPGR